MKFYLSTVLGAGILLGWYLPPGTSTASPANNFSICATYHVFIIPPDKRKWKDSVEFHDNWRCIGEYDGNTPYSSADTLQACQLIVDERDTYIENGERKLKAEVRIIASQQKEPYWYVNDYIPAGDYFFKIRNEQDDKTRNEQDK